MNLSDFFTYDPEDFRRMRDTVAEEPGWRYGSVLPLRSRGEGSSLELEFAAPGFVRDTARGAIDLLEGPATGRLTPDAIAALPAVATPVGAMFAPQGSAGMFAGRLAKTARPLALENAERMARAGADADAVRAATGWFRGPDDAWRWEIDDSAARLNSAGFVDAPETVMGQKFPYRAARPGATLGDVLSHPDLFAAYPDMASVPVSGRYRPEPLLTNTATGSYQPTGGESMAFQASDADGALSTLLHEAQHAIQQREGFAKGGMPTGFGGVGWDDYKRLAGEIEAKDVQARQAMTPEQRDATRPYSSAPVPFADMLVRR